MDLLGNPTPDETPAEQRERILRDISTLTGLPSLGKSQLRIAWEADPRCHWCDEVTVWWAQSKGRIPDNGVTRDHLKSKRARQPGEAVPVVLACYRCNQRRNDEENREQYERGLSQEKGPAIGERQRAVHQQNMERSGRPGSMAAQMAVERVSGRVELGTDRPYLEQLPMKSAMPMESIGSIIADRSVRTGYGSGPYECPMCDRRRLVDRNAFWQHVSATHPPERLMELMVDSGDGNLCSRFETALIRVVNSVDHNEAIETATNALAGGGED